MLPGVADLIAAGRNAGRRRAKGCGLRLTAIALAIAPFPLRAQPGMPPDDPDSVLLSAGWRYFGKDLTANFVFSGRVGQDEVKEYGFSMVLRVDL